MTYRKIGVLLIAAGILLIASAISKLPALQLVAAVPTLLGFRGPKTYLVLLQNNTELRPTGGFMGTFALVTMNRGMPTVKVEDIYAPDGQVKGHVEPPAPIQEAFQLGEWRLRDANWDPDFPTSAKTIEWFMEKAGISHIDGTVATNLIVFEEVLKILGPVHLPDYNEVITAENLWLLGEQYAQDSFFPGSTQKREFFSDLANETKRVVTGLPLQKKIALAKLALRMVDEKQIMMYLHDNRAQQALELLNWAGQLRRPTCPWYRPRCTPLSLMIVEANLGVNKANCCVARSVNLEIEVPGTSNEAIQVKLTLNITNRSSSDRWGGRYKALVRIYAIAEEITSFWIEVPEGETRIYEVSYPIADDLIHQETNNQVANLPLILLIQKQSGITEFPLTVKVERGDRDRKNIKEIKTSIKKDTVFVL